MFHRQFKDCCSQRKLVLATNENGHGMKRELIKGYICAKEYGGPFIIILWLPESNFKVVTADLAVTPG